MAIIVSDLAFGYPGGETLFSDVSFKVPTGEQVGLIGENATGKSTLMRVLAGELEAESGNVQIDGTAMYMPQTIGQRDDPISLRQFVLSLSEPRVAAAAQALWAAEHANHRTPSPETGMAMAHAVQRWGEVAGYEIEATWDAATTAVLRQPFAEAADRPVHELSGGERKRMALEILLASPAKVLLLDEPDNFLDIPAKRWLEAQLQSSSKTILVISHDRELLSTSVDRLVTIEGSDAWTHHARFDTYHEERRLRNERLGDALQRWKDEERRLFRYYKIMKQRASTSADLAARAKAAESRWKRFAASPPPPPPPPERAVAMRLRGKDSGRRSLRVTGLSVAGLSEPFSVDIWYGERVAVLGPNGSGKSHFVRFVAGEQLAHEGSVQIGARVQPAYFSQTNERIEFRGRTPLEVIEGMVGSDESARRALGRYGLARDSELDIKRLSGGQQARLQILVLELEGANLLLLDEPTDNLDLASSEALEEAFDTFEGTVVAVTHDRWFLRSLDRFLIFELDGSVHEALDRESALWAIGALEIEPDRVHLLSLHTADQH